MVGKSKVSVNISFEDFKLNIKEDKVTDYMISKVKPFANGAYIPFNKKHIGKDVIVLVLETRENEKCKEKKY